MAKRKAAIIGGGVIGAGWAARFLLNGWEVDVYDPEDHNHKRVNEIIQYARHSLPCLYDCMLPEEGEIIYVEDIESAVKSADWVQESVPERLELKHGVLAEIESFARSDAIIGSSTSGFCPSELNRQGDRVIVAHPFNPVYLIPLVELVGNREHMDDAKEILSEIGMFPLWLEDEMPGHIADRLLEAVWRESLWLIKDGVATTEEIDDAIKMGFGLRWGQMGLFETYRIAGGDRGMRHFISQFGPALKWEWTKLMDVPDLDQELIDRIVEQSDEQSKGLSVKNMEKARDDNLVAMIRALKKRDTAVGSVVNRHEGMLRSKNLPKGFSLERKVPQTWIDYNGHMNEAHYVETFSDATDEFLRKIGAGSDYLESGNSFFTVENLINYHREVKVGDRIRVRSIPLELGRKIVRVRHELLSEDDFVSCTMETVLVHIDMGVRKSCEIPESIRARVKDLL